MFWTKFNFFEQIMSNSKLACFLCVWFYLHRIRENNFTNLLFDKTLILSKKRTIDFVNPTFYTRMFILTLQPFSLLLFSINEKDERIAENIHELISRKQFHETQTVIWLLITEQFLFDYREIISEHYIRKMAAVRWSFQ